MSPMSIPKSNSISGVLSERPKSAYVLPTHDLQQRDIEFTDDTSSRDRTPTTPSGSRQLHNELNDKLREQQRSATPTDSDVVPIREKAESMSQLRANEADTEEAVVPFHQKGDFLLLFSFLQFH